MATAAVMHSPERMSLQRANATLGRTGREASAPGGRMEESIFQRGRPATTRTGTHEPAVGPPSPGKENFAVLPSTLAASKYGNVSATTRYGKEGKSRARSVSPSKILRLRSGGSTRAKGEVEPQEEEEGAVAKKSAREIDQEFVGMLGEMQVPSSLMHKLMGLDPKVKQSMMKGQASMHLPSTFHPSSSAAKARPAISDRFMRSKSSTNLNEKSAGSGTMWDEAFGQSSSSGTRISKGKHDAYSHPSSAGSSSGSASSLTQTHSNPNVYGTGGEGAVRGLTGSTSSTSLNTLASRSNRSMHSSSGTSLTASTGYATMLKANDSAHLDVAKIKKMRAVLSSESPSWLENFFEEGGYRALVVRLKEVLELEWREEQHDDQLLHELLRCFVALTSTDCGRQALASEKPTPFFELSDLLFSEKRPGELSTRKLLVDLLCVLPDLPDQGIVPNARTSSGHEDVRRSRQGSSMLDLLASSSNDNFTILMALMHNQRDPNKEAVVDFITASHTPRPFKTWVVEMLNVNRDYFWVFCHSSNRFWSLNSVDVGEAQGPKVPGGMTGGVEFEAMTYLTAHFRLINLISRRLHKLSSSISGMERIAFNFHEALFASGFDRCLGVTRKASQAYYQPLHLEMARFFDHARRANFSLPAELEAWKSEPQLLASPVRGHHSAGPSPASPERTECRQRQQGLKESLPPLPSHLDTPLYNPHGPEPARQLQSSQYRQSSGTLVGDAVRRWEQRTTNGAARLSNNGQSSTHDSAFAWMPPKEWS